MPLSEVHRRALRKEKPDPNQSKTTTFATEVSPPFMPDNEFVELLWEGNGQSKSMKKEGRSPKGGTGRYSSSKDDLAPAVPRAHIGMNAQDDDMVPWMNYPIETTLQNDYCSEFFSEFPGFNMNPLCTRNTVVPIDRSCSFNQVRDAQNLENGNPAKPKLGQFFQLSQSVPSSSRSRVPELCVGSNNNNNTPQCFSGEGLGLGLEKHDTTESKSNHHNTKALTNFSHFSRHDALAKANPQATDRLRSCEKASTAAGGHPIELTLIGSASGLNSVTPLQGKPPSNLPKVDLGPHPKPAHEIEMASEAPAEVLCLPLHRGDTAITNATSKRNAQEHASQQSASFSASASIGMHDNGKGSEPVVVSSICSINSVRNLSDDPKQKGKRKATEGEESGYQSEELVNDSVGVKKSATWNRTFTKRSRAAEVHNLSERRRRDRINERMRALQELIPNCNKVDKASMLDEAIEYLKTLQLQVQIMSMGNGICMPPMMISPGLQMQHMQAPQMGHFSPMGAGMTMGMGMGMGYGMGMLDMNSPPGFPLTHVPRVHGSQFPCQPISGCYGMHGLPGSNVHPMFGNSGRGLSLPVSPAQVHVGSFLGTSPNPVPDALGASTTTPIPSLDAGAAISSKDHHHQKQHQVLQSLDTSLKSNCNTQLPAPVQV